MLTEVAINRSPSIFGLVTSFIFCLVLMVQATCTAHVTVVRCTTIVSAMIQVRLRWSAFVEIASGMSQRRTTLELDVAAILKLANATEIFLFQILQSDAVRRSVSNVFKFERERWS